MAKKTNCFGRSINLNGRDNKIRSFVPLDWTATKICRDQSLVFRNCTTMSWFCVRFSPKRQPKANMNCINSKEFNYTLAVHDMEGEMAGLIIDQLMYI